MLLSRLGGKKKRLWPWFEPPAAGFPVKYVGWVWVPEQKEWWPEPVPSTWVTVKPDPYPEPAWPPTRGGPTEVPGWSWSVRLKTWVQTIVAAEVVTFEEPQTLPPSIDQAGLHIIYPLEEQYKIFVDSLIAQGLNPSDARRIADTMGDAVLKTIYARARAMSPNLWTSVGEKYAAQITDFKEKLGVYAALVIIATAVGYLIGTIMERLTFPDEELFRLKEPPGTYIMRYDHYLYSKMVGITPGGRPYYSACEDIGTSWIRHFRPRGRSGIDYMDFPGGFVEEGHVGLYFVKFTWVKWELKYIGMLTSLGNNIYSLREGDSDPRARGKAAFMLPAGEWCTGFHHYL